MFDNPPASYAPVIDEDIISANESLYHNAQIQYSKEANIIGISSTSDGKKLIFHVYQTNEHGVILWEKNFSSFHKAKDYASEEYQLYSEYINEQAKRISDSAQTSISDELLCQCVAQGEQRAILPLIDRYTPYIRNLSTFFASTPSDQEDFFQIGLCALLHAIKLYPLNNNAIDDFRHFSRRIITDTLRAEAEKIMRSSAHPLSCAAPLSDNIFDNKLESDLINEETIQELAKKIKSSFSEDDFAIIAQYLSGLSFSEIENKTNHSLEHIIDELNKLYKNDSSSGAM